MEAVKIFGPDEAKLVTDAVKPTLSSPEHVLVKTVAVALNPTDWKHIRYGAPSTVGCDFSGVVSEVGSAVTRFKPSDRVWSTIHGSNAADPDNGSFSEYLVTKSDLLVPMPESESFEAAACGGVGVVTVGQGLYQQLGLPWPNEPSKEKKLILIWGGSSATGALGIQFAKLSGFEVITTCSPSNFDYVKSLGADAVFDSRDTTTGAAIRRHTHDALFYAWDTIGEYGSDQGCADALASSAPEGQRLLYGTILYYPDRQPVRKDVEFFWSLGYTAYGGAFSMMGHDFPAQPDHYEFMVEWLRLVDELYSAGKIKMHRMEVRERGFEGILGGLKDLKEGKVSGTKLVYRVADP